MNSCHNFFFPKEVKKMKKRVVFSKEKKERKKKTHDQHLILSEKLCAIMVSLTCPGDRNISDLILGSAVRPNSGATLNSLLQFTVL